ncbi:MAG: T9SS type A sorting domain-containing protein [Balneolales bacterium]|nr:T9SS type A sorting domain-containing protein [Balneolales bacterium]
MAFMLLSPAAVSAQDDTLLYEWEPQTLMVKISEQAFSEFSPMRTGDTFLTGIEAIDNSLSEFRPVSAEQVFRTDPRFAERHAAFGLNRWYFIRFDQSMDEKALAQELGMLAEVESAELNKFIREHPMLQAQASGTADARRTHPLGSNDPLLEQQWYLNNTGQTGGTPGADINVFPAWEMTSGSPEVIVLVIESGIDVSHPDLENRLWINPTPGPENGYEDDFHGWNFPDMNNDIQDTFGTGTYSSGITVAQTNNDLFMAGVAGGYDDSDGARIMTVRMTNKDGFFFIAAIAQGFVYGADNGAVISANNWGPFFGQAEIEAISYFQQNAGLDPAGRSMGPVTGGVVMFEADSMGNIPSWSSGLTNPFFVTATDHNDEISTFFAGYGEWVSLSVPGDDVISIWLDGETMIGFGTYPSVHIATGAAALLASHVPGLTADGVYALLRAGSDNIDDLNPGYEGLLGGRLNIYRTLNFGTNEAPPSVISDLTHLGQPTENSAMISWTAPFGFNNEGQAENYLIRVSTSPINELNFDDPENMQFVKSARFPESIEEFRLTGLSPQTGYYAAIKSRNALGTISEISNVIVFITDGSPAINITTSDDLNITLRAGETATRTITLNNPGEGVLHYSFPAHIADGSKSPEERTALFNRVNNELSPGVISQMQAGRFSGLAGNKISGQNHLNWSEVVTPFVEYAFTDLTLDPFEFFALDKNLYNGDLTAVGANITLTENQSNGWTEAVDFTVLFWDGERYPLLVGGPYGIQALENYFWTTGYDPEPGTVIAETVSFNNPVPIDDLEIRLKNNYSFAEGSATWSGSLFFYGIYEKPQYITVITPAAGSLLPGESVEVTLTYTTPQTGYFETELIVRSNDLSAPISLLSTSLLVTENLDYAGLITPATHTMERGSVVEITGAAALEEVTGSGTAPDGLSFEVGFSRENTHPRTWPESAWVSGAFVGSINSTDVFSASTGDMLDEGTWYSATRFTYEGFHAYGGYSESGGGFWDGETHVSRELKIKVLVSTEPVADLPAQFSLRQNYPNPFNPATVISWELPAASEVLLEVYNISGQHVATLVNGTQNAGAHQVRFDGSGLSSGIYLYRLQASATGSGSNTVLVRKMSLVK